MCSLQLISFFTFICLLLTPASSTGLVAKSGCPDRCGDLLIPFPFGVGLTCSLDPSFNITCNTSSASPRPYLSNMNKEVIEINQTYIRVKSPFLISACYDLSGFQSGTELMSVNLSGTPYRLSYLNRVTVIGCDDGVLESNGSSTTGGCSAFCAGRNDTDGVGYCPTNETSLGNGCCLSEIPDGKSFMGAQLIDLSMKLVRRRLYPCSYAFIQERWNPNETTFSYPLHYLENSTTMLNDDWASTTRPPVVRLDWKIGTENCSVAQNNHNTYACRDKRSVCVDYFDYFPDVVITGYLCSCLSGYEGNPYLSGGCQEISFSSSIAKPGCLDQCGKLAIPFPFGVGPNCSQDPSFEIICNTSTNPPTAYLSILNKEIFHINSTQVEINYPNLGFACYNLSDHRRGITKTQEQSLIIDLSATQYTLSDENWITTIGCDDLMVGTIGRANQSFIITSCAAVCQYRPIMLDDYRYCPRSSTTYYYLGEGCCRAAIPRVKGYLCNCSRGYQLPRQSLPLTRMPRYR